MTKEKAEALTNLASGWYEEKKKEYMSHFLDKAKDNPDLSKLLELERKAEDIEDEAHRRMAQGALNSLRFSMKEWLAKQEAKKYIKDFNPETYCNEMLFKVEPILLDYFKKDFIAEYFKPL